MYKKLKPISATKVNFIQILSGIKEVNSRYIAQNYIAWLALLTIKPEGIVTNIDEWEKFRQSKCFYYHSLSTVSEENIINFEQSLKFNELGLLSMDYKPLLTVLTKEQIKDVLSIFGIGGTLAEDHEGYTCSGRASCSAQMNSICMSSCIPIPDFYKNLFDFDLLEILHETLNIKN